MIREAIGMVLDGTDLTAEQATAVMDGIMSGQASDAQIGAFLIALRVKGETVEEITGCAKVMREKATRIAAPFPDVIDTCGTGGDASGTFNISTATAIVAAGAGCRVAKHGNRSVSSSSGSADVLKALGVNILAGTDVVERCIAEAGIGFLFAPLLHGAMKYAIGPRREMGVRTIFNILGPLTNPAFATRQVLGVYDAGLVEPLARVLKNLGSVRCLVVHGDDGLDELTTTTTSQVAELRNGDVTCRTVEPEALGIARASLDDLTVAGADESAAAVRAVLAGEAGPKRDIVLLNAAAALAAGGKAEGLGEGIRLAAQAVDSGAAAEVLEQLVAASNAA